jgi:YidC/Oxa1 family membrane protein insertase
VKDNTRIKDVNFLFEQFVEFMQYLLTVFYNFTNTLGFPSYGIAIILFTLAVKTLLFPLTATQVKSMKAMRALGPQIKKIQEKYKNDQAAGQKEVAELYKTAGVNPLAGCLPMVFQMPILSGMFYALRNYNYVSHPGFLWIKTLSGTDRFYILPLLAALTTYLSSQQGLTPDSGQQGKMMLLVMPVVIGYMTLHFPAGLGLYWVVSNVVQIVHQHLLQRA